MSEDTTISEESFPFSEEEVRANFRARVRAREESGEEPPEGQRITADKVYAVLKDLIARDQIAVMDLKERGLILHATPPAVEELASIGVCPLEGPDSVMEVFKRVNKEKYTQTMDNLQLCAWLGGYYGAIMSSARHLSLTPEGQAAFDAEAAAKATAEASAQAKTAVAEAAQARVKDIILQRARANGWLPPAPEDTGLIAVVKEDKSTPEPAPVPVPENRPAALAALNPAPDSPQQQQGSFER